MSPDRLVAREASHETLLALKPSMPPGVDRDAWDDLVVDLALSLREEPDVSWLRIGVSVAIRHGVPEEAMKSLYDWLVDLRQVRVGYGPDWPPAPGWDTVVTPAREIARYRSEPAAPA